MENVAIIGAGPSGLVAAKELRAYGLTPVVLEKKDVIGGLWKSSTGSTWETLQTNLSEKTCKFSDFPWPQGTPDFPNQQQMYQYFCSYARHFHLEQYIHLNANVQSVEKKDEQWQVKWIENGEEKSASFEYIVIATGIFSKTFIPDIKGLDTFKGRSIHSEQYKTPHAFAGRKVLVLGNAFSGTEISAEIAATAQKVVHVFRKPNWVIPRYFPTKLEGQQIPLDYPFFKLANIFKPTLPPIEKYQAIHRWYASLSPQGKIHQDLEITDFEKPPYVAISDTYLDQVKLGAVRPKKSTVTSINESRISFADGEIEEFDDLIFATGYETNLSYLSDEILQSLEYASKNRFKPIILYRCTLGKDPTIGFIGMERGPYLGVQELQARLIAGIFSKAIPFPSPEEIEKGLEVERAIRQQNPQPQFPQNYVMQSENFAEMIRAQPNYEQLKIDHPQLYDQLMNGFYDNAHFRLFGNDANFDFALELIKQANARLHNQS